MKRSILLILFIFCSLQFSNAQVFLWYSNQMPFDGVNGVGVGNGDGIAQAGESVGMRIEILNNGGSDAHNIYATITCSDPNIVITDSIINFFDLLPGGGDWSYDEFMFDVSNSCVTGYVTFDITLSCFEGSFPQTFLVYLDCTTASVAELNPKNHISIFPNPSDGIFSITSDIPMNEIQVYDMLGKLLVTESLNDVTHQLVLSDYHEVVYQVSILNSNKRIVTKKLINVK